MWIQKTMGQKFVGLKNPKYVQNSVDPKKSLGPRKSELQEICDISDRMCKWGGPVSLLVYQSACQ